MMDTAGEPTPLLLQTKKICRRMNIDSLRKNSIINIVDVC
jgi:hypothetical protein